MKTGKRVLAIVLAVIMLLSAAPLAGFVGLEIAPKAKAYNVGDTIQFGTYPQTQVAETTALKNAANNATWASYNYYSGTGSYDGKMKPSNYMQFADFFLGSCKYRAVTFSHYRPSNSASEIHDDSLYGGNQRDNGFCINTVYYFKYEPLTWRILDPSTGFVMCESIIDAQPYQNKVWEDKYGGLWQDESKTYEASDYAVSSIHGWLKNDFSETAFSDNQNNNIVTSHISLSEPGYFSQSSPSIYDKVFLPSRDELSNSAYGFSADLEEDEYRGNAVGSDYAKCQGLGVSDYYFDKGHSEWWTRNSSGSKCAFIVLINGDIGGIGYGVVQVLGIRPACYLKSLKNDRTVSNDLFSARPHIAIYSTEPSLTVAPGESFSLGFDVVVNGKLSGELKKFALVSSDPSIISISTYRECNSGYALDITGKKEGKTHLTITDTATGMSQTITITVKDKYIKTYTYGATTIQPFYPDNNYENNIETYIYDLNGIYVKDYKCTKSGSKYSVSFTAYNSKYMLGAVDIFDKDGNWITSKAIEKYTEITGPADLTERTANLIFDPNQRNIFSYEQCMYSKKTFVSFDVPAGGYFTISNNMASSIGAFLFNAIDISLAALESGFDLLTSVDDDKTITVFGQLINDLAKESSASEDLKSVLQALYEESIKTFVMDCCTQYGTNKAGELVQAISGKMDSIVNTVFKGVFNFRNIVSSALNISSSVLNKAFGPAGIALEAGWKMCNIASRWNEMVDVCRSLDEPHAVFFTPEKKMVYENNVSVVADNVIDPEAVLQVFRVAPDDTIRVTLNAADDYEDYELFNICFVKNDQLVQPNGQVQVRIPIPDGLKAETCQVLRQESDGSWQFMTATRDGNYMVFYTNHFSLYAITGYKANLSVRTMPSKTEYKVGENLDVSGLTLSLNGKTITSGFLCSPSVFSAEGTQTVTATYGHTSTTFNVNVTIPTTSTCSHVYLIQWPIEPTCTSEGEARGFCILCGSSYTQIIPALGHYDADNDGKCDRCKEQMTEGNRCPYCGKVHKGFFQKIIGFFHKIYYNVVGTIIGIVSYAGDTEAGKASLRKK